MRRGRGSSAEEKAQLPWTRCRSGASWGVAGAKKSFAGEDAGDVVGAFGDLDEAHASAASRDGAGGDIDGEDAAQEPGPRVAGCLGRGRRERGEVGLGGPALSVGIAAVGGPVVAGAAVAAGVGYGAYRVAKWIFG